MIRLITRTETVTREDEWGVKTTHTARRLSTFAAWRERRLIARIRAERLAREAMPPAPSEW